MILTEKLSRLISLLPDKPGVYQMKDAGGKIIYIGKAKNLKKRVSQYFLRPQIGKVKAMVEHVDSFDIIVLRTDKEAFILEMNLIQTHHPRYNIMLMDDSHYPYIALKRHGDPYLKIARSDKDKHYFYFGPFPNSGYCYKTIDLLNKIYPTRKCRNIPNKPCLYYSMGQCLAPCLHKVEQQTLDGLYSSIKSFLSGDSEEVEGELKRKMEEASAKLDFERAGEIKKTLDSLHYVKSKQAVETTGDKTSRDVFAYAERDGYRSLAILTYRNGMLLGKACHVVPIFLEGPEQVADLLEQYYSSHPLPKEIVAGIPGLKKRLEGEIEGAKVILPKEGRLLDALNIAELNARQGLDAHFSSARLEEDKEALLEELQNLLGLKETPIRIELFDNSHLQGSSPVGAMVCFLNGSPCKKMYRKFHLFEEDAGDDYHSMKEVVFRRYSRLAKENLPLPDLILADGGLPQVHATLEGLLASGVSIPVYGLYKNSKHQTEGLIDSKGKTYPLNPKSPLFFLLMRMQDEVHRFAISFHHQQRSKSMTSSLLDSIPGIGGKRKEILQSHYPSIDALLSSSVDELSQILPRKSAEALYRKLHGDPGLSLEREPH